jgi:hypothetical protein
MRTLNVALAGCLLLASVAGAATFQARLIRASNDPKMSDDQLKNIEPKLKKQFGYLYYRQLGVQREELKDKTTHRLDLGEGFVVFVAPKSVEKQTHELDIEWTSGKASLVKSTVKIPEGSHIFIKGPAVANDWILLSLSVRE